MTLLLASTLTSAWVEASPILLEARQTYWPASKEVTPNGTDDAAESAVDKPATEDDGADATSTPAEDDKTTTASPKKQTGRPTRGRGGARRGGGKASPASAESSPSVKEDETPEVVIDEDGNDDEMVDDGEGIEVEDVA